MQAKGWDTACSVCAAGASVVCMSSMAASLAVAGAAAGAGVAGIAGMGSMSGMGGAPTDPHALPLLPSLFERLGLGLFNSIPNDVLQPLLAVLLAVSVGAAYFAYGGHRRPLVPVLTAASGVAMYVSIYVWMSDPLYFLSLGGLVAAALWGVYLARHPAAAPARS